MMEYLEGQSLWERFCASRGRDGVPGLPTIDSVRFTRQLASALVAVHAKGIVHRELMPSGLPSRNTSPIGQGNAGKDTGSSHKLWQHLEARLAAGHR